MLARRDKIVERYKDDAKEDPWLLPEPD
jgi:hypothetical protein